MVRLQNTTALFVALATLAGSPALGAETLSGADRDIYRRAFAASDAAKWTTVFQLSRRAGNKLPAKVLRWQYMVRTGNKATFAQIARFIEGNPDWPWPFSLRRRAEEALARGPKADVPPKAVIDWLDRYPPIMPEGRIALLDALSAIGETERMTRLARNIWINDNLRRVQERRLLRRFRAILRPADHGARLDRLVWDRRWREAQRMLPRVGKAQRALARAWARMRLSRMRGGVDGAIRRVPASLRNDPGLLYERARWRRRKGRIRDAFDILSNLPLELDHPERWWLERVIIARRLLMEGRHDDAFKLVSDHGLWPGSASFANAEWLTGWLALRYLDRPAEALLRFERLHATVRYPISRARAALWAGRAASVLEDSVAARQWYREAARFEETFYGQIAARKTAGLERPVHAPAPTPGAAERAAFERNELVRAVRLLHQIGRDRLVGLFARRIARHDRGPGWLKLTTELVGEIDRRDLGVRIARYAYREGIRVADAAYPMIAMPKTAVEPALMLSIGRQESNFAVDAISPAGARGMMQLMRATARAIARKINWRYSRGRLTRDADYNIRLAMAHLGHLLKRYDNNYVLAIAAYNAGARATARWIRAFGDPRAPDIDLIDWIETIPLSETCNYVQRVLETLAIYRDRLATPGPAPWLDLPDGGVGSSSQEAGLDRLADSVAQPNGALPAELVDPAL